MNIIFVLVVCTYVAGGSIITFQEFTSSSQCNYVAASIKKEGSVKWAECFKK